MTTTPATSANPSTTPSTTPGTAPTDPPGSSTLDARRLPVQAKLAAAWTSFMFLYVYVDILNFYKPGVIDDILVGIVHEFDTGPAFVGIALTLLAIPSLMIVLSVILPARINRIVNLVVATLLIPFTIYNVSGEESLAYAYFYALSIGLELLLLVCILRSAWTWPRRTTAPAAATAAATS